MMLIECPWCGPRNETEYGYGDQTIVAERLSHRNHEYMPTHLLDSQFATLEPLAADEAGLRVSLTKTPDEIVGAITESNGRR